MELHHHQHHHSRYIIAKKRRKNDDDYVVDFNLLELWTDVDGRIEKQVAEPLQKGQRIQSNKKAKICVGAND